MYEKNRGDNPKKGACLDVGESAFSLAVFPGAGFATSLSRGEAHRHRHPDVGAGLRAGSGAVQGNDHGMRLRSGSYPSGRHPACLCSHFPAVATLPFLETLRKGS